jgi:vancomycin resistance protein VanJ
MGAPKSDGDAAPTPSRARRTARVLATLLAIGYPAALLAVVAALRFIGERWWVTTVALYLPRLGFALPLPFVVLAAALRSARLLALQAASIALLIFPLLGLRLGGPRAPTPGATHLRVFSANIGMGGEGIQPIFDRARATLPDVIALEEVGEDIIPQLPAGFSDYPFFRALDQFAIISRFPIEDAHLAPDVQVGDELVPARYVSCRIVTPGGAIRFYVVHPVSPHEPFSTMRGRHLRNEVLSGRAFEDTPRATLGANTTTRLAQVAAIAADAAGAREPVVIAGDTNLPDLSWALAHYLGAYRDGFAEIGRGFGYTYPAQLRRTWMRIDRVLADGRFRFLSFEVLGPRLHDHLSVAAELELTPVGR